VVEAVVDEMVEADVVIARQAHSARRSHPSPEKPGGSPDGHKGESEQKWRQLEHSAGDYRALARRGSTVRAN
jgi:hypothetical protein